MKKQIEPSCNTLLFGQLQLHGKSAALKLNQLIAIRMQMSVSLNLMKKFYNWKDILEQIVIDVIWRGKVRWFWTVITICDRAYNKSASKSKINFDLILKKFIFSFCYICILVSNRSLLKGL